MHNHYIVSNTWVGMPNTTADVYIRWKPHSEIQLNRNLSLEKEFHSDYRIQLVCESSRDIVRCTKCCDISSVRHVMAWHVHNVNHVLICVTCFMIDLLIDEVHSSKLLERPVHAQLYLSIWMRMNFYLLFSQRIGSFFNWNCCDQGCYRCTDDNGQRAAYFVGHVRSQCRFRHCWSCYSA